MNSADEVLNPIAEWAKGEELVRGLLLVGSRALQQPVDDLADLDLGVFTADFEPYLKDSSWISQIAPIWVYSPDKYHFGDVLVPTRLVIYERGAKVDYSFWHMGTLDALAKANYFDSGYKTLLDKDGLLKHLGEPSFKPAIPPKPTEEEFVHGINEYWFEAYHVAKYLKRDDLWLVKFRDYGSIKCYLLKMMEWYTLAKNDWNHDVKWTGKHIKWWLDPGIYSKLDSIFAHFNAEDSWRALIANNDLFRDLSKETSKLLGYAYPSNVDNNLTGFILDLHKNYSRER